MMMDNERREMFDNFLKGDNSKVSEELFIELFQDKSKEPYIRQLMEEHWESVCQEDLDKPDLDRLLHKIHFLINSQPQPQVKAGKVKRMLIWYSRIAAVLLLPILTLVVLSLFTNIHSDLKYSTVEVIAPWGSRVETQLPDGSKCWLYRGSTITYSIPFDKRQVKVEGEAFFDVKTDSLNPFMVDGKYGTVKVLGTRFNVKMWPDDDITEVVLEKGEVAFLPSETGQLYRMKPNEKLVYNGTDKRLTHSMVNPNYYSSWIDGKLMLRGENTQELASELSRWFNVEVEAEDHTLEHFTFRATFQAETLDEVLRLLKMTSPIDYEIIDNYQKDDGSFSKKKIVIRHK